MEIEFEVIDNGFLVKISGTELGESAMATGIDGDFYFKDAEGAVDKAKEALKWWREEHEGDC